MKELTLLSTDNITKNFGGLTALKQVSFDVSEGQIKSVIGPNGAGKTTLFNIISGLNYGEKIFDGDPKEVVKDQRVIEAYLGEDFL